LRGRGIIAHERIVSFIQDKSLEALCSLNVIIYSKFYTGIKLPSIIQVIQNASTTKLQRVKLLCWMHERHVPMLECYIGECMVSIMNIKDGINAFEPPYLETVSIKLKR
jgi:hypothetical protein